MKNLPLPRFIMNTLLTTLAAVSAVMLVATAFEFTVSLPLLILSTLLFSGAICFCFLRKKALIVVLPALAVLLGAGALLGFFDALIPTLQQMMHDMFTRFASAYPNYSIAVPAAPEAAEPQSFTLLFAVAAAIWAVWMAWGVGFRSSLIVIAGSLPLLLVCVIVNDTPPSAVPLTFLLAVWVTILMSPVRPEDHPGIESARMVLVLMATLLLIGTVALFYPKENINREQLPEFIQEILEQLPGPVQEALTPDAQKKDENLGADTSELLDLTTQGPRDRKDTVMMQLSATESGVLYLRAAAKDVYTGTTWESMNMASQSDSVYAHTSIGTSFGGANQAGVQIRNYRDKAEVVFTPYGYISCTNAEDITTDLRISMLEDDYIIYYWPGVRTMDLSTAKGVISTGYDSYVNDVCLELPEETRQALYDMAIACGYDPTLDTLQTVAWVAEFIRSAGTYELNVDYQPADQDFALYFLNYSRQGYCVHYATAAAAMYRALGIPSRYASGYRVDVATAGEVTDVTDQDTHAWAEVYLSGIGWIPVETTPGFGESAVLPEVEQEVAEPPEPSPEPESPSEEPVTTPTPTPTPEPQQPQDPTGQGTTEQNRLLYLLLLIPLALVLGIIFLVVRRIFRHSRRKRHFFKAYANQAVLYMYQYLEKVCRYGPEMPEDLEGIALKAKFSQHEITREERDSMYYGLRDLSRTTERNLSFLKKLRFRWISCLHMK